jgi:hypothetical protein
MSPSGTFPFSDVPESNHQHQIEVVSYVDLLCAYTPSSSFATTPLPGCEVPSLLQQNLLHYHF